MTLTDRAEEALEILWVEIIEHKKEKCDAGALKDSHSLKELVNLAYVAVKDNKISLTPRGEEEAKNCVRRHRLAERLFKDYL